MCVCLRCARSNGHLEVVRALVSAGVDVDTLTQSGSTAVDAAIFRGEGFLCMFTQLLVHDMFFGKLEKRGHRIAYLSCMKVCFFVCMYSFTYHSYLHEGHLRVAQFLLGAGAKSKSSPVRPFRELLLSG